MRCVLQTDLSVLKGRDCAFSNIYLILHKSYTKLSYFKTSLSQGRVLLY